MATIMTEPESIEKDLETIDKLLPQGAEEYVEDSRFTERELSAYLLAERTDLTWEEAAEEMGISYGTYCGKMGNSVETKKDRARATVKLIEAIEGK